MTESVRNDADRDRVIKLQQTYEYPYSVNITKGAHRSNEQNKLQRKWVLELQEQGDQTAEEYRGFCKLHFGIPILRAENEVFCEKYDRLIRPLDYEVKLEYMMVPFDFPVTRIMTVKQTTKYLDAIYNYFTEHGFILTRPERG